MIHCVVLTAE